MGRGATTPFLDKVAIVTGGASGIGRALCEELARSGAMVIVADIDGGGAERVAAGIVASGGRARAARVDVSQAEEIRELVDATTRDHGRLDFMFNNAGVGFWGEVRDTTLEQWRRVIDINLWGVVYGSTAAYAVMARQGFGHIVNTASLAGLISVPTVTPYATAKHAVVGFSTSLRAEAADLGVRVSVVCPGPVRTRFHESLALTDMTRDGPGYPAHALDAGKAAEIILRDVARNRAVIVFPFRARLTWMIYRWVPALIARLTRKSIRRLRASRRFTSAG